MIQKNKEQSKENKKQETKQENIERTSEKEKNKAEEKRKQEKTKQQEQVKKKEKQEEKVRKEKAVINGKNLPISTKHSIAICKFIKGKTIEKAALKLNEAINKKTAIPMKGELPHRKGIMSGRFPQKACKHFLKLLKTLHANSINSGIEDPYIFIAKANKASRPYRRFGSRKMKRSHVYLESKSSETEKINQLKKEK